jgi:hypothetical protein
LNRAKNKLIIMTDRFIIQRIKYYRGVNVWDEIRGRKKNR